MEDKEKAIASPLCGVGSKNKEEERPNIAIVHNHDKGEVSKFSHLPSDVFPDSCEQNLPIKSILTFKSVSREWRPAAVSRAEFARRQLLCATPALLVIDDVAHSRLNPLFPVLPVPRFIFPNPLVPRQNNQRRLSVSNLSCGLLGLHNKDSPRCGVGSKNKEKERSNIVHNRNSETSKRQKGEVSESPHMPSDVFPGRCEQNLHIRSILTFKRVCKEWRLAVSRPEFARRHLLCATPALLVIDDDEIAYNRPNYIIEDLLDNINPLFPVFPFPSFIFPNPVPGQINQRRLCVSNSAQGLLGVYNEDARDPTMICNLITGDYFRSPGNDFNENELIVGFGYTLQGTFKIVRICIEINEPPTIDVFTVGTANWRAIEGGNNFTFVRPNPVYCNGNLYFIVTLQDDNYHGLPIRVQLVCFDLQHETFSVIPWPVDAIHTQNSFTLNGVQIGVVGGRLYALRQHFLPHPFGFGAPVAVLQPVLRGWSLVNDGWVQFFNATLPAGSMTRFGCPELFDTPGRQGCYTIYVQKSNLLCVYEGAGMPIRLFRLESDHPNRTYVLMRYIPNIMPIRELMGLHENTVIHRCIPGAAEHVMLLEN